MQPLSVTAHDTGGRQYSAQKLGVFFCRCAKAWRSMLESEVISRLLGPWAPDVVAVARDDLCRAPDQVANLSAQAGLTGAVIPACAERAGLAQVLKRAGILPWAIETIELCDMAETAGGVDHIARQLAAAVARVRARWRATPDHLQVSYGPQGQSFDRRALLRSLFEPTYQVMPAVETSQCRAAQGCRLCLDVCQAKALRVEFGSITVHKEACTACGACVPTCPSQAITWPGFNLADLDAQLAVLLDRREASPPPTLLIITCAKMMSSGSLQGSDAGMIPPGAVVLPVPCASLISPALLLRSFERGARSVAVLSCAGTCQQGHDRRRVRTAVSFTIKVLETFGMTAGRLMLVEGHAEESGDVAERLPKLEQSATVPPASEGLAQAQTSLGLQDLSLPAILSRLQAAHGLPTLQVITGADVPFGQVRVQGATPCTLCGVCAQLCPSQALALTQLPMSEALIFSHSRCVACGLCVEQCPEKILHLDRALDLGGIAEPARVLAREDVIRCRRCQCPIAALSMLAKVHQALRSLPSGVLWDPGELCPSCRLAESVSVHAAMSGGRAEP